ncbi:hypothetical protein JKG47_16595, partial [Acidithiobacillus sp. MC6.1]|nr:hypothetical protein [Acidithiobacillus sp. MC6.1]
TAGPITGLFNGRNALLQVTLPFGLRLRAAPAVIRVETGDASARVDARLISPSPRSDPSIQGETYFYDVPAQNVRIGMRVTVDLPLAKQAVQGVVIPAAAVLWYANQAWVYLQMDQNRFVRHIISTQAPVSGGWFEMDLQPGQRVVTQGAQLLLSQELQSPSAGGGEAGEAQERQGNQPSPASHDEDHDND